MTRSSNRRWIYAVCGAIVVFFGALSLHEGGSVVYAIVLVAVVLQLVRPTVFVWGLLVTVFAAYGIAVLLLVHSSDESGWALFGIIPAAMLFWARPQQRDS
jgi:hypothetical protein